MTRIAVIGRLVLVLAITAVLAPLPAIAQDEPVLEVADWSDDVVIVDGQPAGGSLGLLQTDPLGLITGYEITTAYTLSNDLVDVWACGSVATAAELVAQLDDEVGDYFAYHSRGRYRPVFTAKGSAGSDTTACSQTAIDNVSAGAEAAMVISPGAGGVAYNIHCPGPSLCSGWEAFPTNNRIAFIGESYFSTTAAHELGHLVQWPHSYTGNTSGGSGEYDNAMDLMSGNYGRDGNQYGSYYLPYEAAVISQYAAGWIDPSEVWVVDPAGDNVTLSPTHSGIQMAVLWDGSSYYTLAARAPETYDPISSAWKGVEVYKVTSCTDNACLPGFRRVVPEPAVPFVWSDFDSYDSAPAHVITAGTTRDVGGVSVTVNASGSNFTVQFGSGADPGPTGSGPGGGAAANGTFADDDDSVFESDIEWLAASGITAGCNPPENTLFCPDDPVTRGAMAAFLHRALPTLDDSGPVPDFGDTAGSVFVGDIDWLAATGVTKGCNPPANDQYCPDDPVTRGAMAAFLVRALGLTDAGSVDFVDDNTSVFESDIERLATAGITLGCNPPANDRFCPADPVTRGAMAAFLRRALDG